MGSFVERGFWLFIDISYIHTGSRWTDACYIMLLEVALQVLPMSIV